jgi:hypothetical protein
MESMASMECLGAVAGYSIQKIGHSKNREIPVCENGQVSV